MRPCFDAPGHRSIIVKRAYARGMKRHVFRDGHDRHQHEMLMHDTDAARRRLARRAKMNRRAIPAHLTPCRRQQAADDVHQGAFTRAVLAQQAHDLARADAKINFRQRREGTENARHAA